VLNYCHTALDAVFPEIKRDTASSADDSRRVFLSKISINANDQLSKQYRNK